MPTIPGTTGFMTTEGEITVTFDPADVGYVTDIARRLEVEPGSARAWINRRLKLNDDRIPRPLFTLLMAKDNYLHVWKNEDIDKICEQYTKARKLRAASM